MEKIIISESKFKVASKFDKWRFCFEDEWFRATINILALCLFNTGRIYFYLFNELQVKHYIYRVPASEHVGRIPLEHSFLCECYYNKALPWPDVEKTQAFQLPFLSYSRLTKCNRGKNRSCFTHIFPQLVCWFIG